MSRIIHRGCRWVSVAAVIVCGLGCHNARARAWPTVRAIHFAGNDVTRPRVMRRELLVHVGKPADPALIERSRQAILDLGLFKSVSVRREPVAGGVALTFVVAEKWYILPLPRVELNPGRDSGYGGQLRWNNVWGLNHTLNLSVMRRHYQESDKSSQFAAQAAYGIPFIDNSAYGLAVSAGHTYQDSTDASGQPYRESFDDARMIVSRSLAPQPSNLGWRAGAGLAWHRENTAGANAPPPRGKALGLVGSLSYNALSLEVYGEHGQRLNVGYEHDFNGLASDYSASLYTVDYLRAWHVGDVPYQNLRVVGAAGLYSGGGARGREPDTFALGGSRHMRGYGSEFAKGNFSYYVGLDFLRPVYWKWLRALIFVEAGSVYPRLTQTAGRPIYVDVGVGARLRVVWLVNLDLQAGIAFPLVSDGRNRYWRLFAGS